MDLQQTYYDRPLFEPLERLSARWGWVLALGIVMTLAGVLALGATVFATLATVTLLGAVLFVGGLVDVVSAFTARGWRGFGLALVTGILAATVGVLFMTRPLVAAGILTLLLAVMLLVNGIARIAYAVLDRFPGWGWSLASGIAAVVLGVLLFLHFPSSALWFLGLAIAIELLLRGTLWIALAFTLRRASPRVHGNGSGRRETPMQPQPGAA
jgi:uncharacterized membrane protein HdeD (DUF308 family)